MSTRYKAAGSKSGSAQTRKPSEKEAILSTDTQAHVEDAKIIENNAEGRELDDGRGQDLHKGRYETVEQAKHFKHFREGCNTGYIDLQNIRDAIPELDLLEEWKNYAFGVKDENEVKVKAGSSAHRRLIADTIAAYQVWYKEAEDKVRAQVEQACKDWIPDYSPEKQVSDYTGDSKVKLIEADEVLAELHASREETGKVIIKVDEKKNLYIRRAQLKLHDYIIEEEEKFFMTNEEWKHELKESLLSGVPEPTADDDGDINVVAYDILYSLYVRVRAKLIDRYELDIPARDVKPYTHTHRLWRA
jgi:hypothetical protein